MTLAAFIQANIAAILTEWESLALTLQPAAENMTTLTLRNHGKEILLAMARDTRPRNPMHSRLTSQRDGRPFWMAKQGPRRPMVH